jgi:hypothetical protein
MTYLTLYRYNFCWCMRTLRVKHEDGRWRVRTPALAAGLTDHLWTWREWFTVGPFSQRRTPPAAPSSPFFI